MSYFIPRAFDIEELNNRTRLNLDYAAEKQKEILQLETAVTTLRNTTAAKEAQIQKLGEVKKIRFVKSFNCPLSGAEAADQPAQHQDRGEQGAEGE